MTLLALEMSTFLSSFDADGFLPDKLFLPGFGSKMSAPNLSTSEVGLYVCVDVGLVAPVVGFLVVVVLLFVIGLLVDDGLLLSCR